jgi:hypothetical protein
MCAISAPKTREQRVSRAHPMHRAIGGTIAIHGAKSNSWGLAEFPLEIEGNKPLDGRAAAAHLVVCCVLSQHTLHTTLLCVLLIFVGLSPSDCRVNPSKLGKLSLQQKLGNNGPPKCRAHVNLHLIEMRVHMCSAGGRS